MIARTLVLARVIASGELLLDALQAHLPGIVRACRVEACADPQGWIVVSYRVELGATPPKIAVRRISERLGVGWLFSGEGAGAFGTWSSAPGARFVVEGVVLADVEVLAFTVE